MQYVTAVTLHDTGKQNNSTLIVGKAGNTNATQRILSTQTPKKVISVGLRESPIPRSVAKNTPFGMYKI